MDTPIQPRMPLVRDEGPHEGWAIVELFGHTRLAGKVSDVEIAGGKMLRLDIPPVDGHPGFTKFVGAGALYSLTPTTEEIVIGVIRRLRPVPITPYDVDLRPRLPAGVTREGIIVTSDGTPVTADDHDPPDDHEDLEDEEEFR